MNTTIDDKAKELVDKFKDEINSSDFHLPEFITGVPCADGSEIYNELLKKETESLAKQCALICVSFTEEYAKYAEQKTELLKLKEKIQSL